MLIDRTVHKDTLVVKVAGELDLVAAERFRSVVDSDLDRRQVRNLVLNLEGVSFIDSSGLGAIIGRYKRVARQGGAVVIAGAQPQVKRLLEMAGMMRIVTLAASEREALKKLNAADNREVLK